jgi:hypothetical protein
MKLRLPILAAIGAVAAIWLGMLADFGARHWTQTTSAGQVAAAKPPVDSSGQAERLVHQAAERLDQYASISAKLRLKADIFNEKIVGSGQYRQGSAASHLLRWDSTLHIGEHVTSMQQIVDGTRLWMYQGTSDKSTLRRVELSRVLAVEEGLARTAGKPPLHGLGLGPIGGLPKLLRSLDLSVNFTSLAQARLPARFGTQGAEVPVYIARGTWTPAVWAKLLPEQAAEINAGQPPKLKKLPQQVPDQVVVTLGRDDWFPYRIEFLRAVDDSSPKSLFVVELYDVQWNVPLDRQLFSYQPGLLPVIEFTEPFVGNLLAP